MDKKVTLNEALTQSLEKMSSKGDKWAKEVLQAESNHLQKTQEIADRQLKELKAQKKAQ